MVYLLSSDQAYKTGPMVQWLAPWTLNPIIRVQISVGPFFIDLSLYIFTSIFGNCLTLKSCSSYTVSEMNIAPEDQCLTEFETLKFRKGDIRYIVYVIKDEKIVVDHIGDKNQNWDSFIQKLPENQFRYCVFDFEFTNADNMHITKLIFVNWNPDSAPIKNRVLYATAKENFKKYLDLNNKDYVLCSKNDMTRDDMIKELSK